MVKYNRKEKLNNKLIMERMLQMIRTSKKAIDAEISSGAFYKLRTIYDIESAVKYWRRIAYSGSYQRFTGLVFLAPSGQLYATTEEELIAEI